MEYAWYVRQMQPGFSRACAPRMPAQPGRQEAGVNNIPGFCFAKPEGENRQGAQ
jgi:hypothetical protein